MRDWSSGVVGWGGELDVAVLLTFFTAHIFITAMGVSRLIAAAKRLIHRQRRRDGAGPSGERMGDSCSTVSSLVVACLTCTFALRVPCSVRGCGWYRQPSCRPTRECPPRSPPSLPPSTTTDHRTPSSMQLRSTSVSQASGKVDTRTSMGGA